MREIMPHSARAGDRATPSESGCRITFGSEWTPGRCNVATSADRFAGFGGNSSRHVHGPPVSRRESRRFSVPWPIWCGASAEATCSSVTSLVPPDAFDVAHVVSPPRRTRGPLTAAAMLVENGLGAGGLDRAPWQGPPTSRAVLSRCLHRCDAAYDARGFGDLARSAHA